MCKIARNARADYLRTHSAATLDQHSAPEPTYDIATPSRRHEENEEKTLLGRALMLLPESSRELLVLARFQEMEYEDIAELTAYRSEPSGHGCTGPLTNSAKPTFNYEVIDRHAMQRSPELFCRLRERTAGCLYSCRVCAALEGVPSCNSELEALTYVWIKLGALPAGEPASFNMRSVSSRDRSVPT
jgi:hypothetical protein